MKLRDPMAVVAAVLAEVLVVVAVILVSRYQAKQHTIKKPFNTLNADLNPICHRLVLLGAHPILYISRIRVNLNNWCGVKIPAHKSSSPHTQKISTGQQ
jgi:hypothetical protein